MSWCHNRLTLVSDQNPEALMPSHFLALLTSQSCIGLLFPRKPRTLPRPRSHCICAGQGDTTHSDYSQVGTDICLWFEVDRNETSLRATYDHSTLTTWSHVCSQRCRSIMRSNHLWSCSRAPTQHDCDHFHFIAHRAQEFLNIVAWFPVVSPPPIDPLI